MTYDEIKNKKPQRIGTELGTDGQNYIIALDEEKAYSLSVAAYYVWALCDGNQTVEELVTRISKELNASEDEIKDPIATILEKLTEVGLIKFA